MSSLNKALLIGNVGNKEVKDLQNGNKLVQISLATTSGYKKPDGTWENKTEWHRCIFAIPALAERAVSINKGDKIYVEGSISTNSWTTKEGEKKETKEISCTSFTTFAKAESKENSTSTEQPVTAKAQVNASEGDDLPF